MTLTTYEFDPWVLRGLGFVAAAGGAVVLYLTLGGPGRFPEETSLTTISGTVSWLKPNEYAIRFGLERDERTYSYADKSGAASKVSAALSSAAAQPITMRVAPRNSRDGVAEFEVLEVISPRGVVRPIGEVKESWARDNRWGYFSVALLWLVACNFEFWARKFLRGPPAPGSSARS